MRFDQTFIAIRERPTLEIFDLALHVTVAHFRPLFWLLVIGALPWVVLDFCLLGWMLDDSYDVGVKQLYYWAMGCLVINQAQVGTCLVTQYLGKAMFVGAPRVRDVVRDALRTSPYWLIAQGVFRMVAVAPPVCLLFDGATETTFVSGYLLLTLVVGVGLGVRAFRPYVTEILMLERTPIRARNGGIHFGARSRSLHTFASGDLFGKFLMTAMVAACLAFAFHSMLVSFDSIFNIRSNADFSLQPYYLVLALWLVAGFISVARFLSYIDLRIRQEGWAVELRIRAEAQRLANVLE